ncbi:MAG: protoporphyrinogen oxidase [Burkholderiales bacterium]
MAVDAIVVGAGISGLVVAHALHRLGRSVVVLEASSRAGGVIATARRDGALVERGPNSTLDTSPAIGALLDELGLAGERVDAGAAGRKRFVVRDGTLRALPMSPAKLVTTRVFSFGAKLRVLREPFIAAAPPGGDESVASFVRRRLGDEFLDYAINPFVAGIYAGDPARMSVAAAFPRLVALERDYGGLIRGQIAGARARRRRGETPKAAAGSFSFRNGMQSLTDALAAGLPRVEYGVRVEGLAKEADGFAVAGTRAGEAMSLRSRTAVLATEAPAAAAIVDAIAPDAARALSAIDYAPIAIVVSCYARQDIAHPLDGFGFLVPEKEKRKILGTLFSSTLFPGRAPEGSVLLTTFVGGRRNPECLAMNDAELAAAVHTEMAALLGAGKAPAWQDIVRWPRAIPQYEIGHPDRVGALAAAEANVPGLWFCANYRGGVSVGDRVVRGIEQAAQVDAWLAAR